MCGLPLIRPTNGILGLFPSQAWHHRKAVGDEYCRNQPQFDFGTLSVFHPSLFLPSLLPFLLPFLSHHSTSLVHPPCRGRACRFVLFFFFRPLCPSLMLNASTFNLSLSCKILVFDPPPPRPCIMFYLDFNFSPSMAGR